MSLPPSITRHQAPPFTKHESARLHHFASIPDVPAGVVSSEGPLTRQQLDAGHAKHDVWSTVVAEEFNDSSYKFLLPSKCSTLEFISNLRLHQRLEKRLKGKFSEVSSKI